MSHEKSITVKVDDRFINVKTRAARRALGPRQAVRKAIFLKSNLGGRSFATRGEAETVARTRSSAGPGGHRSLAQRANQ